MNLSLTSLGAPTVLARMYAEARLSEESEVRSRVGVQSRAHQ